MTAPANTLLKSRHRALWAAGDYAAVAADIIPELGPELVRAAGVRAGQRVLDVAAGTGNAAVPAALTGAHVTASDLTPELLQAGRRLAEARGVTLDWVEADAEDLPFERASFDVVMSCVGVMFAPLHQAAAGELLRVCRPGGTIALLSWTPAGFVGQLFAAMQPFAAQAAPAGAQPPPLWGDEGHVLGLLGDGVAAVTARTGSVRVTRFARRAAFREYFRAKYGPILAVYRALAGDPERTTLLDMALDDLAARFRTADGAMVWEYLLLTATRTGV